MDKPRMKVMCIMLANGQPLFYENKEDGVYHDPAMVFLYADDNGQQKITFQHLLAFSDKGYCNTLNDALTLTEYEVTHEAIHQAYSNYVESQRERRSGIIKPNSPQGQRVMNIVQGGKK